MRFRQFPSPHTSHDEGLRNYQHDEVRQDCSSYDSQGPDVTDQRQGQRNVQCGCEDRQNGLLANAVQRGQQTGLNAHEAIDDCPDSHGEEQMHAGHCG